MEGEGAPTFSKVVQECRFDVVGQCVRAVAVRSVAQWYGLAKGALRREFWMVCSVAWWEP